jgi:SAM-dependent methyltransferase
MWNYTAFFNNPTKFVQYQTTDISAAEEPDIVDDILHSKLADASADGIVYVGMGWDVQNTEEALKQVFRILKPGGLVFIDFAAKGDTRGGRTFEFLEAMEITMDKTGFYIDDMYWCYEPIQPGIPWYTDGMPIAYFFIARKPTP